MFLRTIKDIACVLNEWQSQICKHYRTFSACMIKDLSYKDRHWHENCFKCAKCSRSLVDKPFAAKDDLLLCTECYSHEYSSKCTTCKKTVMPGTTHYAFSEPNGGDGGGIIVMILTLASTCVVHHIWEVILDEKPFRNAGWEFFVAVIDKIKNKICRWQVVGGEGV